MTYLRKANEEYAREQVKDILRENFELWGHTILQRHVSKMIRKSKYVADSDLIEVEIEIMVEHGEILQTPTPYGNELTVSDALFCEIFG
jgi:hypothetical protein